MTGHIEVQQVKGNWGYNWGQQIFIKSQVSIANRSVDKLSFVKSVVFWDTVTKETATIGSGNYFYDILCASTATKKMQFPYENFNILCSLNQSNLHSLGQESPSECYKFFRDCCIWINIVRPFFDMWKVKGERENASIYLIVA